MKKLFLLSILLAISISGLSFPQLDSVWYQGPFQGSIPGGAIRNTNDFTDELIVEGDLIVRQRVKYSSTDFDISTIEPDNAVPSIYIEDSPSSREGITGQEIVLRSFLGIPMSNYIPPDPTMAAGPNHIIVCANSLFRIYDKQGNLLKNISAAAWWGPVSTFEAGDPQVIYDHFAQRWVLVWMEVNDAPPVYGTLIGYSDDDNPLGIWYIYRLPHNSFPDYPKLGFDHEAIYIMTRQVNFGYNWFRIINKSELYSSNAGPLTYKDLFNMRTPGQGPTSASLDCLTPAISYTPGNGGWFLWARGWSGSAIFYALYKVTNPLTNPGIRGKLLFTNPYFPPPSAGQLGGGQGLEAIGWMSRAPVVRDGFMYAAHDVRNSTNPSYSSVKYLKIDLSTPSLVDNIEFGNAGYFYLYPALAVDKDHNVAITFTRSGDTEYAGAYFSARMAGDPPGLNPSIPFAVGQGNYVVTFGSGRNRWGDYMGIYLDPVTERSIWMATEYASATNTWAVRVAEMIVGPFAGAYLYSIPNSFDFKEVEVGTKSKKKSFIFANYGNSDLIIYNIPGTFSDFNLESALSFPLTISSYDSLTVEFSFSPSIAGLTSVVYPISTNDPNFTGIELTGKGYNLVLATEKTLYASSGSQNSGNMITINPVTGAGTLLGSSTFTEVTSISLNPVDGKIYGLVAATSSADILKINAAAGDAHIYFTLNISQMAAIAFDTSGVLYAITRSGDLYKVDLDNGSASFVVDAVGSYLGMTFHPQTNELWATSRAVVPPNRDAVFKVNMTTGDTTIVGRTGLGKQTNDIIFDESLNLFGVIGAANEFSDFVRINTSTGAGTIIGPIGFKNILSLAYIDKITTSIKDDKNDIIPSEFALKQNYPNPFNPITKIEFSLPVKSTVNLIVYNILGQEVIQLVDNDELSAGNHSFTWNAKDAVGNQLTSGIYLYKLTASGTGGQEFQDIKKMILLK